MAVWGAFVCLLAVTWVAALPAPSSVIHPKDLQDVTGRNSRIVSGWEAVDGQIPYQLSIRMVTVAGQVFSCGATLIHNEWALTAAHCTDIRVTIVIRAGSVHLNRPELIFETTEFYNHPDYFAGIPLVQPNDIALLKLNRFVEYTRNIQPIRLASSVDKDKDYSGQRLQASGWGVTWTNGVSPVVLNWVYLLGVSNQFCRSAFGGSSIIVDSTICASAYNVSSQSTCQGDSGGPLVVEDVDGRLSQVGISSFVSNTGCHTDFPAGFARPAHYHAWYTQVTGINFDWDPTEKPETTVAPEVQPTTAAPEVQPTTAAPEVQPSTAAPEVQPTTSAPEVQPTTAAPEVQPTTSAPEVQPTTAAPEVQPTTAAPEAEVTTAEPEEEVDATTVEPEEEGEGEPSSPEEEGEGEPSSPEEDGEGEGNAEVFY